jgi:hypothetical protein
MQVQQLLKRNKGLILVILIVILILYVYVNGENSAANYKNEILKKPIVATGLVTSIRSKYKHGYEISYEFLVDNVKHGSTASSSKYESIKNIIVGKRFPVIFNRDEISFNEILIMPEDFNNYDMAFPDSLAWVRRP